MLNIKNVKCDKNKNVKTLVRFANTLLKDGEIAQNTHVLACNFAKYSPI